MNIITNQSTSSTLPVPLAIGAHHEHDKEFEEMGENLSTFRTNPSVFSTQLHLRNPIIASTPEIVDEEEDGKHNMVLIIYLRQLQIRYRKIFNPAGNY